VGLDARYADAVERFRAQQIAAGVPKGRVEAASKKYARRLRAQRAQTIARYEVAKVLADAQRVLWGQQQIDGEVSRYAVRVMRLHKDERLCKVCRPLNGKRASLAADGGYDVQGIGHMVGPPFHPQCRCYEELVDEGVSKTDPRLWGAEMSLIEKKGKLDWSPKSNWVEEEGGLPKPIEEMAHDLITERGMTRERAIAVSINRARLLAAKGNPKYIKAIAQWEAMKARRHAK
jgi:hypothetical protein